MTRRAVVALCSAAVALIMLVASPRAQTPIPTASSRVVKIVGDSHKLLLRADGSVAGWGQYKHGQLGRVAAITPGGDPISLLALSIPLIIFYEMSIWIGRAVRRRRT